MKSEIEERVAAALKPRSKTAPRSSEEDRKRWRDGLDRIIAVMPSKSAAARALGVSCRSVWNISADRTPISRMVGERIEAVLATEAFKAAEAAKVPR